MSIASRINEIGVHLTKDWRSIEALTGTATVDKNIENIATVLDNLWEEMPKVTGTGESLTLNTKKGKMKVNLLGNTSQTEAPTPSSPIPVNVVSGDNTIKVEGKNLFDENELTLNTTQVDNKTCYEIAGITSSTSNVIWNKELKANTQYTISMVAKRVLYFNNITFYYTDGTTSYVSRTNADFQRISATSQENKTLYKIQVDTGDRNAKNYIEVGTIQLEKSSTATDYEPYQSQTYEVDLGVENLFDKNNIVDDSLYNPDGTINTSYSYFRIDDYIYCHNMDYLTISGCVETGGNIILYDENKNYVDYFSFKDRTLTIPNNVYYYRFGSRKENKDTLQLEFSSKANSYTPYGTTPIELCKIGTYQDRFIRTTGKNLCDIVLDSSVGNDVSYKTYTLKPNTQYTISTNTYLASSVVANVFADAGTSLTPSTSGNGINGSKIITSDINGNITIGYRNYYNNLDYSNGKYWIMLNEGSTALPYEPYGTNEWYLEKKIGKVVLDGSEAWVLNSSSEDSYRYWMRGSDFTNIFVNSLGGSETQLNGLLLCNYFSQTEFSSTGIGKFSISNTSTVKWFLLNTTQTALSDFKSWLSTHNTDVYYPLATPYLSLIEDNNLIEQLDNIQNAMSYQGTTNIGQVNDDKAFIISATALKDLSEE